MITVAGEALMDVLSDESGSFTALPGGAPFNVARTIARLGGECEFLGRLSEDGFGQRLRAALETEGVGLVVPRPTAAPTTLAIAQLDGAGSARYSFYLAGTSAARLEAGDVPPGLMSSSDAVSLGGLGIVIEPTASTLLELIGRTPPSVTVLLDPNCRPSAIADLTAYRARVDAFLSRVDIVKVSVEDLELLRPGADLRAGVRELLALGPAVVLVTDGSRPVTVHTATAEQSVPVPAVDVVDTIGAGDAFVAGLLTWWASRSLTRQDVAEASALIEAARAAVVVAAAACRCRGANLPRDFSWPDAEAAGPLGRSEP